MASSPITTALLDIRGACMRHSLVRMLGWQDVRQRYRRSVLGPFWLSISMALMIGIMWVVFSQIYHMPMREFLPYLASGMILWNFIALVMTESCLGFITVEKIIKELPLPLFIHVLRLLWRNILIFAHNLIIFPLVFFIVGKPLSWIMLLSLPGFLILVINLAWLSLLLSIVCARYRDLSQMVTSFLQIFFYLTPIMWVPSLISNHYGAFLLGLNPVYHLITLVRSPLLGQWPSPVNWIVSLGLAGLGWFFTLALYGRFRRRIVFWL